MLDDMERVRAALGISAWNAVYGHCNGATLALRYAMRHPGLVPNLLMSDTFYADVAGNEYFFGSSGPGAQRYPQAFANLRRCVSVPADASATTFLRECRKAMETTDVVEAAAVAVPFFEWQMRILHRTAWPDTMAIATQMPAEIVHRVARLQLHHYSHHCWVPPLQRLIEQARSALADTRISIVHAAYDGVCTPRTPQLIEAGLPNAELWMDPVGSHQSPAAMARIRMRLDEITEQHE